MTIILILSLKVLDKTNLVVLIFLQYYFVNQLKVFGAIILTAIIFCFMLEYLAER